MSQHLNNQLNQIPINLQNLQGFNFTILNNQQHHLGQFAQPGQQGHMYQIVQQIPGQPNHVQLQNVQQHQFGNHQFHQLQTQQLNNQFNQQQQFVVQQPIQQAQIQQNHVQQIQQQVQQPQIQQQPIQQQNNNQSNNKVNNNHNNSQVTKSGKKKKAAPKVGKDGQPAPKRATTAYINFTQFYREQIKSSGRPVPKIGEFGKECAAKWNSMNAEEKRPFTEEAERDRERYRKEMEVFKPARDNNKPKRPGTAFMLFMVDFRKEIAGREPEGGVAALAKLGGERWRSMTDEEKKPYTDKQGECKAIYEQKMEEYRKINGQTSNSNSSKTSSSVKSEVSDSDTSEQLNNSLSNLSSKLNNDEHHIQNHNNLTAINSNNSPGSTSASPHPQNQQTMSPQDPSQLSQIPSTIPLQSQTYYTNFLDQHHDDASYSQSIDQHLHDGHQQQEQNDQQAYLQNGTQNYHYNWN